MSDVVYDKDGFVIFKASSEHIVRILASMHPEGRERHLVVRGRTNQKYTVDEYLQEWAAEQLR